MSQTTFDSLDFYQQLLGAGVEERQADIIAKAIKTQKAEAAQALRDFAEKQEKRSREELATKADVNLCRKDVELARQQLQNEMAQMEVRLIKWMLGLVASAAVALFGTLGAMMGKGFGWW